MISGGNTVGLRPPWQPGQSGNPNGRPKKVVDVTSLALDVSAKAMEKLAKLVDSEDDRVALQAAIAVLDRAVGKPKQALDVTKKKEASDYSESELLAIARMGSSGTHQAEEGEREPNRFQ